MAKRDNLGITVIIYDRATGGTLVSDSEALNRLTDDDVQITASNLAYGMIETVWGLVDEE